MKRKALYIGSVILLIISAFILVRVKRFVAIDRCLDKGGRWDKSLNECDCISRPDSLVHFDNFWYAAYDICLDEDLLIKGKNVNPDISVHDAAKNLNRRNALCKVHVLDIRGDTLRIEIINDQVLSEQMGTTGSYFYLAETVFTLTEIDSINSVYIDMEVGSHASPGLYDRDDYNDLKKKETNTR